MIHNQVKSIIRRATRSPTRSRLCAIDMIAHERVQSQFDKLNCDFYCFRHHTFKGDWGSWNEKYARMPQNYFLLEKEQDVPLDIHPDVVISHHKFSGYGVLKPIAERYAVPLIQFEHTIHYDWPKERLLEWNRMRGDINIFITDNSRRAWLFDETNSIVIEHGVPDIFHPKDCEPKPEILVVANDYVARDIPLGYSFFKEAAKDIKVKLVGDNPGLSSSASSTGELIQLYQSHPISVSTARYSPIPMSILEHMACGGCVIARPTSGIPDVIKHKENGLLANTPEEMNQLIKQAQSDPDMVKSIGAKARDTIVKRFSVARLLQDWNRVLNQI